MISGIVLIFAVPLVIAAALIPPNGLHYFIHGVPLYVVLGLLVPVVGWRTFLIEFALPRLAESRLAGIQAQMGPIPTPRLRRIVT